MNIELMGASFDPPHVGHNQIVVGLLAQNIFDEVWLVPAKKHAFAKSLSGEDHRLAMLQLFLEDFKNDPVRIETYELEKDATSYSQETLTHFSQQRPLDTFAWVIGSDNLVNFPKWYKYLDMLQNFNVYVYPRPGYPMEPLLEGMVPLAGVKEVAISSTEIRNKLKLREDVTNLVGPRVAAYIAEHGLYQPEA